MCRRFAKGGIRTPEDNRQEVILPLYDPHNWQQIRAERVTPTRPCKVDGEPALFHRFVDNDRGVLRINTFCKPEIVQTILKNFNDNNFTDHTCEIEKFRETRALIEWPDGRLSTVAVEQVQFTDRSKISLEDVRTSEPVTGRRW